MLKRIGRYGLLWLSSCLPFFTYAVTASSQPFYTDGARWAFITDAATTNVAVLDTFEDEIVDYRQFQTIATDIAVSDVQSILVYIGANDLNLYVWDLSNDEQWQIPLPMQPHAIKFHGDGALLAIAGDEQVVLLEPLTQKMVHQIPDLQGPLSLNFTADGYRLMITSLVDGKTTIWLVHHNRLETLQMGKGTAVTDITLSPDTRLGMVSEIGTKQVHIWDFSSRKDWRWLTFDAPIARPYVTSDSNHLVFTSSNGEISIMHGYSGEWISRFQTEPGVAQIRTGWLERIGVVEGPSGYFVFNLSAEPAPVHFPTQGSALDLVVISDSKSLFATNQGSKAISVLDLRSVSARAPIMTALEQPNRIAMGLTNTVCH